MTQIQSPKHIVPPVGSWVRVTTDFSQHLHAFSSGVPRRHTHVGIVTLVDEDGRGFEMTTGERKPYFPREGEFFLREILTSKICAIEVCLPLEPIGLHALGLAEAQEREAKIKEKEAERVKKIKNRLAKKKITETEANIEIAEGVRTRVRSEEMFAGWTVPL